MKPKINRKGDKNTSNTMDMCQTPDYAVEPLLPYLPKEWIIWESADGDGNISRYLRRNGYITKTSDILDGPDWNFFTYKPSRFHAQVTNPPYSCKYDWLERSLELCTPFALLVPVEMMAAGKTDKLRRTYLGEDQEFEYIIPTSRINFIMPNKGDSGTAQFPTMWLCHGLNINRTITRIHLNKPSKRKELTPCQ